MPFLPFSAINSCNLLNVTDQYTSMYHHSRSLCTKLSVLIVKSTLKSVTSNDLDLYCCLMMYIILFFCQPFADGSALLLVFGFWYSFLWRILQVCKTRGHRLHTCRSFVGKAGLKFNQMVGMYRNMYSSWTTSKRVLSVAFSNSLYNVFYYWNLLTTINMANISKATKEATSLDFWLWWVLRHTNTTGHIAPKIRREV